MIDTFDVKKTKISKKQIIRDTAKSLGDYTQAEVEQIYNGIRDVIYSHLQQANDDNMILLNLGNGLSLQSKIKYVNGNPRLWMHSKISRYKNRAINDLI